MHMSTRVSFIIKYLGFCMIISFLIDLTCILLFNFLITVFLYKYVLLLNHANLVCLKSFISNKLTFATSSSLFIKVNKRVEFTMSVSSSHT